MSRLRERAALACARGLEDMYECSDTALHPTEQLTAREYETFRKACREIIAELMDQGGIVWAHEEDGNVTAQGARKGYVE